MKGQVYVMLHVWSLTMEGWHLVNQTVRCSSVAGDTSDDGTRKLSNKPSVAISHPSNDCLPSAPRPHLIQ